MNEVIWNKERIRDEIIIHMTVVKQVDNIYKRKKLIKKVSKSTTKDENTQFDRKEKGNDYIFYYRHRIGMYNNLIPDVNICVTHITESLIKIIIIYPEYFEKEYSKLRLLDRETRAFIKEILIEKEKVFV